MDGALIHSIDNPLGPSGHAEEAAAPSHHPASQLENEPSGHAHVAAPSHRLASQLAEKLRQPACDHKARPALMLLAGVVITIIITATISTTTESPRCSDHIVDSPETKPIFASSQLYKEQCDLGEDNSDTDGAICRTDCMKATCNDGVTDHSTLGEECDRCLGDISGSTCKLTPKNWPEHICSAVTPCLAPSEAPELDTSACTAIDPGETCTIRCATHFAGNATELMCPEGNVNPKQPLLGDLPSCSVACEPLPALNDSHFNTSACARLSIGEQCEVSCIEGYKGNSVRIRCDEAGAPPTGPVPQCEPLCEKFLSNDTMIDGSNCHAVAAGQTCTVACAIGFVGASEMFTCSADAEPGDTLEGRTPTCEPAISCAGVNAEASDAAHVSAEQCSGLAAGSSCEATCSGGYVGTSTMLTCPEYNTDPRREVEGVFPACIAYCADFHSRLASVDATDCHAVAAGQTCTVACAIGFVGASAMFTCSAGAEPGDTLEGRTPTCDPIVSCASVNAEASDATHVSAEQCSGLAAGSSCEATCSGGYVGTSTMLTCPEYNTDPRREVEGPLPTCLPTTGCAPLHPIRGADVSSCSSVMPGSYCEATCAGGYVGTSTMLTCPEYNTDPRREVEGVFPTCIAYCADFHSRLASVDATNCHAVAAGQTCTVACAIGFVGASEMFTCSADAEPGDSVRGHAPTCDPIVSCAGVNAEASDAAHVSAEQCSGLAAGSSCEATCSRGYVGTSTMLTCPEYNTDPRREVEGVFPACIAYCADFHSRLASVNGSNCHAVAAGQTCTVACAIGFVGASEMFTCSADAEPGDTLEGRTPTCDPIVSCAGVNAEASDAAHVSAEQCSGLAAGSSCEATCSRGYCYVSIAVFGGNLGASTMLTCPEYNTDPRREVEGVFPACSACCADFHSRLVSVNGSNCHAVAAGQTCTVACAIGFVGASEMFTCSADAEPGDTLEGRTPTCDPIVSCAGVNAEASDAAHVSAEQCSGLAAGSSCEATCSGGYVGTSTMLTCPKNNTDPRREVEGVFPACIAYCADFHSRLASVNGSNCHAVAAGQTCTVACAIGFVGASEMFTCSADAEPGDSVRGHAPTCDPIVSCAGVNAEASDAAHVSAEQCSGLAAGSSCEATCSRGYVGTSTMLTCPEYNTDPRREVEGPLPTCLPTTGCAPLHPIRGADVSSCSSVMPGSSCLAACTTGYGDASGVFTCPADNTDSAGQLQGTLVCNPRCAPLQDIPGVNVSSCVDILVDASCEVDCSHGFSSHGQEKRFACPGNATAGITQPQPIGDPPECMPIVGCAALVPDITDRESFDVSRCARVPAGGTCTVGCSRWYEGHNVNFTCPPDNTEPATQPIGTMPSCGPICSYLDLPEVDGSNCSNLLPGATCIVSPVCPEGMHSGEPARFRCPRDATAGMVPQVDQTWLRGSSQPDACFSPVACAPLSAIQNADVQSCARLSAGESCTVRVSCDTGYVASSGTEAEFVCPLDNMDPTAEPVGTAPICVGICATLPGANDVDVSNCSRVHFGVECEVRCSPGFVGNSETFHCPLASIPGTTLPVGRMPRCDATQPCLAPAPTPTIDASDCAQLSTIATGDAGRRSLQETPAEPYNPWGSKPSSESHSQFTATSIAKTELFMDPQCAVPTMECGLDDENENLCANGSDCPDAQPTPVEPEIVTFVHLDCVTAATDPEYEILPDPNDQFWTAIFAANPELQVRSILLTCSQDGTFQRKNFADEGCTNAISGAALDAAVGAAIEIQFAEMLSGASAAFPRIFAVKSSFCESLETGLTQSPSCVPIAQMSIDQMALTQYYVDNYGIDLSTAQNAAVQVAEGMENHIPSSSVTFTCAAAGTARMLQHSDEKFDEPDCSAETTVCLSSPQCVALLGSDPSSPQDMAAILANTEGSALMICQVSGQPCGIEVVTCMASIECAALLDAPDLNTAAMMVNTEAAALLSCQAHLYGCADHTASNYVDSATIDDGSCEYPDMEPWHPSTVRGCTNSEALNYNDDATDDDGSCYFHAGNCKADVEWYPICQGDQICLPIGEACPVPYSRIVPLTCVLAALIGCCCACLRTCRSNDVNVAEGVLRRDDDRVDPSDSSHTGDPRGRWSRAKQSCCFKLLRGCSLCLLSFWIMVFVFGLYVNVDEYLINPDVGADYAPGGQYGTPLPERSATLCNGHGTYHYASFRSLRFPCVCDVGYYGPGDDYNACSDGPYESQYELSGSSGETNLDGVYVLVEAHCHRRSGYTYDCDDDLRSNRRLTASPTTCDGVPVYQRGGDSGPVLYRNPYHRWAVGPNYVLTDCGHIHDPYALSHDTPSFSQLGPPDGSSMMELDGISTQWTDRSITALTVLSPRLCQLHGTWDDALHECSACTDNFAGRFCDRTCGEHGTSDGSGCLCDEAWFDEYCTDGPYELQYVLSGSRGGLNVDGVYTRVENNSRCNGVPVYQREGRGGPVLYRTSRVTNHKSWSWHVGPSERLADCSLCVDTDQSNSMAPMVGCDYVSDWAQTPCTPSDQSLHNWFEYSDGRYTPSTTMTIAPVSSSLFKIPAGGSCTVRCAAPFGGPSTTFTCPSNNTNPQARAQGSGPTCTRQCAPLEPMDKVDVSSCQAVEPGGSCYVPCSSGYAGSGWTYECPADAVAGTPLVISPLRDPAVCTADCRFPTAPDPCLFPVKKDCGPGGVCDQGQCSCSAGYSGEVCQLDPCHNIECGQHGECRPPIITTDIYRGAECVCTDGWSRGTSGWTSSCDVPPDPCEYPVVVECSLRGTCREGRCHCYEGYSGTTCEHDPCYLVDCGEHGVCRLESALAEAENYECIEASSTCTTSHCACDPGFAGDHCEHDPCYAMDCAAQGKVCAVEGSIGGCHDPPDPCVSKHCPPGSTCDEGECVCGPDFEGPTCKIPTNCTLGSIVTWPSLECDECPAGRFGAQGASECINCARCLGRCSNGICV